MIIRIIMIEDMQRYIIYHAIRNEWQFRLTGIILACVLARLNEVVGETLYSHDCEFADDCNEISQVISEWSNYYQEKEHLQVKIDMLTKAENDAWITRGPVA